MKKGVLTKIISLLLLASVLVASASCSTGDPGAHEHTHGPESTAAGAESDPLPVTGTVATTDRATETETGTETETESGIETDFPTVTETEPPTVTETEPPTVTETAPPVETTAPPCEHEYSVTKRVEPTCTKKGSETYACVKCGDSYKISLSKIAHDDLRTITPPTCGAEGFTTVTCQICGRTLREDVIPATGEHDYDSVVTEATCGYAGYTTLTCRVCGDVTVTDVVPATGEHEDVTTVVPPTCATAGYTEIRCLKCGRVTNTDSVPATGEHNFETKTTPATCVKDGATVTKCSVCGLVTESQVLPATGKHEYQKKVVPPTCSTEGFTATWCALCGRTEYSEKVPAAGHNYDEGEPVEATCLTGPALRHVCSDCGHIWNEETGPMPYHAFSWTAPSAKKAVTASGKIEVSCGVCGATAEYDFTLPEGGHKITALTVTKYPTCKETGEYTFDCPHCGKTLTGTVGKIPHGNGVQACYTTRDCTRPYLCVFCRDNIGQPTGHKYDGGTWVFSNGFGDGVKRFHCTVCGIDRDFKINHDLPAELTDNTVLRALRYIGYDVDGLIRDGLLYSAYGTDSLSHKYRSKVTYTIPMKNSPEGADAIDMVKDSSTFTGKAPNVARFRSKGLICASFTAYYLLNYLPNIEGYDIADINRAFRTKTAAGYNLKAVRTWSESLALAAQAAFGRSAEKIGTSFSNVNRSKLSPGDVILFRSRFTGKANAHVALYLETVDGVDFVAHCTYPYGIEISTIDALYDPYGVEELGSEVSAIYHLNLRPAE